MAERRMFSKTIIDSDRFLDMPLSAQLLYFQLTMRADDDGFVDKPRTITRMIGAGRDDMETLIENGYILRFDSGIVVIKHWRVHNYIQKDRYKPTVHTAEKAGLSLDENNVYIMDTACTQSVSETDTQDRIGQDRSGQDRSGKDRLAEDRTEEPPAECGRSEELLTDKQRSELADMSSVSSVEKYENKIFEWQRKNKKRCKDPFGTIRKWIAEDKAQQKEDPAPSYDLDDYEKFAMNYDFDKVSRNE